MQISSFQSRPLFKRKAKKLLTESSTFKLFKLPSMQVHSYLLLKLYETIAD